MVLDPKVDSASDQDVAFHTAQLQDILAKQVAYFLDKRKKAHQ